MKKTIPATLILSLLFIINLHSQPPHSFTQYSTEDGLSQKTVNVMLQDQKGYMWFATWDGIYKFDGYIFKNYKAHPGDFIGLTNNRIDNMAEDKYGYMWVLSYDRHIFRFNPQTGQFQPIPFEEYQAKSMHVFPDGNVWIITNNEGLLHIQTNEYNKNISVENFSQKNNIPLQETIYQIIPDSRQNQWVLTGNGIYALNSKDSVPVSFFVETQQSIQKQAFYNMAESEDNLYFTSNNGHVWIYEKHQKRFKLVKLPTGSTIISADFLSDEKLLFGTSNDGFMIYNQSTQMTQHFNTTTNRLLKSNHVEYIYLDCYKEAWILLKGIGITHFNPLTEEIKYFVATDKSGREIDYQFGLHIHEDINKNLWINSVGGVLSCYDRKNGKLVPFCNDKLQSGRSTSNRMTTSYSDKQGNLWLCTYADGLEKITFKNSDFHLQTPDVTDYGSLTNDIRALFEDNTGRLWAGAKDKTIRIYDKSHQFIGYLTSSGTISPTVKQQIGMAYSIIQDHKGIIWIGTKGDGLIAAVPGKNNNEYTLIYYTHTPFNIYSLSNDDVYCVYEDAKGKIWIATYGGGLNYIEQDKDNRCIFINHRNHLKNYPINQCYRTRFITSDNEGNIWVGTTTGLLSFKDSFTDPEKITFNHSTRIPGDINSLSNNDVHNIFVTQKNEIFIATFGGGLNKLISYENGNTRFQAFTTENGLPSDIFLSIEEDSKGNLWLTTEEEICKFIPEQIKVENYNDKFFPLKIKFNEGISIRLKSGEIVLNTNKGFLTFNPDSICKSSFIPEIVFTELLLGDKIISPGEKNGVLTINIDDTSQLVLPHKNNSFSIQYAALDLRHPDDILYAYKLDGFEENWNYVGKRRIATYTNLSKGEYKLLVKSTNSDGIWTKNTRSMTIKILPSFWETPWAILLYALGLIAVILAIVYILFTFYRLKNEVVVEQKISDIKLRFFTNISHELRTPLTLIAGPVEHILRNSTLSNEVHEQLVLVEKNTSRMLRLVNQILDFRKIQNKKMKMQVQLIDIIPFIRHIMESFYSMADEHEIDFVMENESSEIKIWADADKLEKIMFNLLSNAFKYTPQGKQIKVFIKETVNNIFISIQDQGIGIAENKQDSLFIRFENLMDKNLFNQPSTGIGLSLVKELVEMHKGTITINSKPGEGSCFNIELFKGKEHFDEDTEFILADYFFNQNAVKQSKENTIRQIDGEPDFVINKESMLLVEDNTELRFFLKTLFAENFNIIEAENGKTGCEKALKYNPDIIISDVMMPETDGIMMTKQLRANIETSHIPIVLLTAKSNIESKIEGLEFGADDYITKPFSAMYLKARIYNLLEQRKRLQVLYYANLTSASSQKEEASFLPALTSNDKNFMDKLMVLMEKNIDNGELIVEDLALKLGMSRSVFFKKLKSLIGLSPVEFIKEIRIKRAAELIEEGENNMAQIAYMVGFNDSHYFSKCFKQVFSMTPTEYKEANIRK